MMDSTFVNEPVVDTIAYIDIYALEGLQPFDIACLFSSVNTDGWQQVRAEINFGEQLHFVGTRPPTEQEKTLRRAQLNASRLQYIKDLEMLFERLHREARRYGIDISDWTPEP